MSNYTRSAARERELVNESRADGRPAWRTPGSKGPADVVRCREGVLELIQVKVGGTSPYSGFGPAERKALTKERKAIEQELFWVEARAFLAWWPADHSGRRLIAEEEWPK